MRTSILLHLAFMAAALAAPLATSNVPEVGLDGSTTTANATLGNSVSGNGLTTTNPNETVGDLLVSLGVVLTSPSTELISALRSKVDTNETVINGNPENSTTNSNSSSNLGTVGTLSSITGSTIQDGDVNQSGTNTGEEVNGGVNPTGQGSIGNSITGNKFDNSTVTANNNGVSPKGGNGGIAGNAGSADGGKVTIIGVGAGIQGGTTIGNEISDNSFNGSTVNASNRV